MEIIITHKIGLDSSLFALLASAISGSGGAVLTPGNSGAGSTSTSTTGTGSEQNSAAGTNNAAAPQNGTGEVELDAAGVAWDPEKHASTKTKVGSGLWRMKVGVKRPDGEGEEAIKGGAGSATGAGSSGSSGQVVNTAAGAEDDEFAAFYAAAGTGGAAQARTWADADLAKLCNQAAVKAGSPVGVKEEIAKFCPAGEIPHSRLIPADKREEFAKAVEQRFGIVYEG